jgi:predicted nuclease of predicted toxin-antitoxin system
VKLLLDENLSDRLVGRLSSLCPGSRHVKQVGLAEAEDQEVWEHAAAHGYVLISKDKDFYQLSALRGAPPKVIWLRIGNRSTNDVADLIQGNATVLAAFEHDAQKACLILAADPA